MSDLGIFISISNVLVWKNALHTYRIQEIRNMYVKGIQKGVFDTYRLCKSKKLDETGKLPGSYKPQFDEQKYPDYTMRGIPSWQNLNKLLY